MSIEKRFLILSQGRSGSTLLCSLFDSHPDVTCQFEILEKQRPNFVDWINKRSQRKEVFGFKVKPGQLLNVQDAPVAPFLRGRASEGWRIIHLKRNNRFRQALSNAVLNARKLVGKGSRSCTEHDFIPPIHVDPELLVRRMRFRTELERSEETAITEAGLDGKVFSLSYEDLNDNVQRQVTMNRAFQFIGVWPCQVSTPFFKVTPVNWRDLVTNPDEIAKAVKDTEFASMVIA